MLATCGSHDAIELILVLSLVVFSVSSTILTLGRDSGPDNTQHAGQDRLCLAALSRELARIWHRCGRPDRCSRGVGDGHGWEPGRRQVHGAGIRFDSKFGGQCTLWAQMPFCSSWQDEVLSLCPIMLIACGPSASLNFGKEIYHEESSILLPVIIGCPPSVNNYRLVIAKHFHLPFLTVVSVLSYTTLQAPWSRVLGSLRNTLSRCFCSSYPLSPDIFPLAFYIALRL